MQTSTPRDLLNMPILMQLLSVGLSDGGHYDGHYDKHDDEQRTADVCVLRIIYIL